MGSFVDKGRLLIEIIVVVAAAVFSVFAFNCLSAAAKYLNK
jgi:hypothetical protein